MSIQGEKWRGKLADPYPRESSITLPLVHRQMDNNHFQWGLKCIDFTDKIFLAYKGRISLLLLWLPRLHFDWSRWSKILTCNPSISNTSRIVTFPPTLAINWMPEHQAPICRICFDQIGSPYLPHIAETWYSFSGAWFFFLQVGLSGLAFSWEDAWERVCVQSQRIASFYTAPPSCV